MDDPDVRHSATDQTSSAMRRAAEWLSANRSHWIRALLMLLFYVVLSVLRLVVGLVALFQVVSLLLTGQPNETLRHFGGGLGRYAQDLVAYLTCADDQAPFPFGPGPDG